METKTDYNGYANWATWNVALWFANDQNTYYAVRRHSKLDHSSEAKTMTLRFWPNGTPDMDNVSGLDHVNFAQVKNALNELMEA